MDGIFDNRLSRLDTIPGGDRQRDFSTAGTALNIARVINSAYH